ncbi:O-antigen ligase family protein [Polaribacter tangerinus]|uniref:O-antigen ligase family protein n=1 Tax=Polaribacter tangerinus TaxID=1920034 RepID=UPI0013034447|nr:O-antigen ligase family protein [Polaribacter tangerinus]
MFVFFSFFPLLPFKIKGLPVFVFACFAFFVFKKKEKKFDFIYLINSLLFILYIGSLFYSENIQLGLSLLETTLSLIIIPLIFTLYSGYKKTAKTILREEFTFKYIYIISSFILSILIFIISFQYGNYISTKIELSKFLSRLNTGFFWINEHPIYLSIYLSLSLLIIVSIFKNSKIKVLLLVIGLFQFFILLLLSRKGVIISFLISSILLFLITQKRKKTGLLFIMFFFLISSFFVFKFTPDTIKRFKEVFDIKSYNKVEKNSSTSVRYGVYNCALEKISESLMIGYGIGDVQNELQDCYKSKSKVLVSENLNSHNQYFGILLSVGVLGLIIFIIPLVINLKLFFIRKDYLAFSILLMFVMFMFFENILDRQSGVILFSFLFNFYTFKNYSLKNNE